MFFTRFRRKLAEGSFKTRERGKRHFRPALEQLEDRLVPTAFLWTGANSVNWNDNTNWTVGGAATLLYPGKAGATGDTAEFDMSASGNCELNVSVTLAKLQLDGGTNTFGKILTITTGHYAVVQAGTFEFDGGKLNFDSGTRLDLDNSTGNWKGGDFSHASGPGTVYVFNDSTLNILTDAQQLGANLVIGETSTGADSNGELDVSSATAGMSGNVTLYQNVTITNYADGTINFKQSVNCDTKGGIVLDVGSTASTITNKGTINRTTVNTTSTDPTKQLKVLAAITQQDNDSATITIGAGCWLYLNVPGRVGADLNVNSGFLKVSKTGGLVASVKVARTAKRIELATTGGTGNVNFYINGDLTTDGAAITFDYTPGAWGVLNVSGNLTVAGGTEVDVNVNGTTSGTSDQIVVAGSATLTSGTVSVTAQNSSATAGYSYTILTAGSGISGTWGYSPTNAGSYPDTWSWDSMSQGVLDCTNPPAVTALSASAGPFAGGTSLTITGSNFVGVTAVYFGGSAASSFTVTSPTSITATAPGGTSGTTVDVTVTTPDGTSATSSADQFTYVTAPSVMSVSPSSGLTSGGTSVSISGSGFTGATAVYFGATAAASFTVNSDGSITAVSPAGSAGTVDVTVVNAGATSATTFGDRFTYAALPVVTGISPSSGSTSGGTSVTISGSGFTGATAIYFGGTSALWFTVNSDGSITVTSPNSFFTGTVDITVVTAEGTSATSSADQFTYT